MKTILVTGSNGQLGNEIRERTVEHPGYKFLFTDLAELDITQAEALEKYFTLHTPDYLVNCAAYTAVDKAENDKETAFLINASAPELLNNCCNTHGTKLIHISTDYVFDGTKRTPYTEEDETNPESVYGMSKLKGEQAVSIQRHIIIRTSWLYSAYGNNFIKTMLRISKERDKLRIVNDQTGCPTWAGDLAAAILELIEKSDKSGFLAGIYHYSNEGQCTWYELACSIIHHAAIHTTLEPIKTNEYPLPARRPAYSVMNKQKIKTAYHIPIPHWEESLKVCLQQLLSAT